MKKSELKDEIKRYHEECEKLKSEKESVQQELSRYIANYIELSNAVGKVKFENRELNQRILNQSESISRLREENNQLKGELALSDLEIKRLKSMNYCSGMALNICNEFNKVTISTDEYEFLKADNKRLRQILHNYDKFDIGIDCQSIRDENQNLKVKLVELEKENRELKDNMVGGFADWCDGFILGYSNKPIKVSKSFWRIFK